LEWRRERTNAERSKGSFVADEVWARGPALGDEGVGLLECGWDWRSSGE
jgi:hypothetical protein